MKTLALLCVSLWSATVLCAQQPARQPVPPPGPLLNPAPDFAQWTVTSKTAPAPAASAQPSATPKPSARVAPKRPKAQTDPRDQTISVVKTGTIRFEQVTGVGVKTQRWCLPDVQITIGESGTPTVSLPGKVSDNIYSDYSKSDFRRLDWISARNFTGIENVAGQDCLVFRDRMKMDGKAEDVEPPEVSAYINAATHLPVKLQVDEEVSTYEFGLAPTTMLIVPPEVQTVVDKWRETMRQSSLMPAKP